MDSQPLRHDAFGTYSTAQKHTPVSQRGNVVKTDDGRTLNAVSADVHLGGKHDHDTGEKNHAEVGQRNLQRFNDGKGCLVSVEKQEQYCDHALWMLGEFKQEIDEASNELNQHKYNAGSVANVPVESLVGELERQLKNSQDRHDQYLNRAKNLSFTGADMQEFHEEQKKLQECRDRFLECMKKPLVSSIEVVQT